MAFSHGPGYVKDKDGNRYYFKPQKGEKSAFSALFESIDDLNKKIGQLREDAKVPTNMEETIKIIEAYQRDPDFHPFTCRRNSNHTALVPHIENDLIVLKCHDCDYVQEFTNNAVIEKYKIIYEAEHKNQKYG